MNSVVYTSSALRALKKLPPEVAKRIFNAVKEIKETPHSYVKKLKTASDSPIYSLRVGECRSILTIEEGRMVIFVSQLPPPVSLRLPKKVTPTESVEVGHRSKVYRKY